MLGKLLLWTSVLAVIGVMAVIGFSAIQFYVNLNDCSLYDDDEHGSDKRGRQDFADLQLYLYPLSERMVL